MHFWLYILMTFLAPRLFQMTSYQFLYTLKKHLEIDFNPVFLSFQSKFLQLLHNLQLGTLNLTTTNTIAKTCWVLCACVFLSLSNKVLILPFFSKERSQFWYLKHKQCSWRLHTWKQMSQMPWKPPCCHHMHFG